MTLKLSCGQAISGDSLLFFCSQKPDFKGCDQSLRPSSLVFPDGYHHRKNVLHLPSDPQTRYYTGLSFPSCLSFFPSSSQDPYFYPGLVKRVTLSNCKYCTVLLVATSSPSSRDQNQVLGPEVFLSFFFVSPSLLPVCFTHCLHLKYTSENNPARLR